MKHKGFEIRETTLRLPTSTASIPTLGIYDGERLVSYAENATLAKRAIDAHTQAGIWKAGGGEKVE